MTASHIAPAAAASLDHLLLLQEAGVTLDAMSNLAGNAYSSSNSNNYSYGTVGVYDPLEGQGQGQEPGVKNTHSGPAKSDDGSDLGTRNAPEQVVYNDFDIARLIHSAGGSGALDAPETKKKKSTKKRREKAGNIGDGASIHSDAADSVLTPSQMLLQSAHLPQELKKKSTKKSKKESRGGGVSDGELNGRVVELVGTMGFGAADSLALAQESNLYGGVEDSSAFIAGKASREVSAHTSLSKLSGEFLF